MHFDHQQRPVASVEFDFAAVDAPEPEPDTGAERELALLRLVLAVALGSDVRRDALPSHLAALAHLVGGVPGFATVREAAESVGCSERSVKRSLARLRGELSVTLQNAGIANKDAGLLTRDGK